MTEGAAARAARVRDLAAAASVVIAWAALRHGLPGFMDLVLADETLYHLSAWRFLHGQGLALSPEGSPLYVAWCGLWQVLCGGDAAVAYFAQWLVTDLLLTLAVFGTLRAAAVPAGAAAAGAVFWASLDVVSRGWPRVSFLALLLALAGAWLARGRGPLALVAGLALATLTRSEYALPLLAALAGWALAARSRTVRIAAAGTAVAALMGAALLTSPRLWLAFSQHYAMVAAAERPGAIADHWVEHERLTGAAFPGAQRVSEAIAVSPRAFGRYVAGNVARLPVAVADGLAGRWSQASLGLPLSLALLALLGLALAPLPGSPPIARGTLGTLSLLVLAALPSLFVYPKAVYLLPALLLGTLAVARGANRVAAMAGWGRTGAVRGWLLAGVAVVGIGWCWQASPRPAPRPILEAVRSMRAAHASLGRPSWRLLENDLGWCLYLGPDRCVGVALDHMPNAPLRATLERARPDAILVSRSWRGHGVLVGDPEFARFLQAPEAFGFRRAFASPAGVFFVRTTNREAGTDQP